MGKQSKLRRRVSRAVARKMQTMKSGDAPRVLDLFAGCGGISLGFERAGCRIVGGIEQDADAADSFHHNFRDKREIQPNGWLTDGASDVTKVRPDDLAGKRGLRAADSVDVIVGGPPCQAFSRVGRAKLRHVSEDPDAWINDPRTGLYKAYLKCVTAFAPCAICMENVPDFLSHGKGNLAEEVCRNLRALGYDCWYTLMNAAHYGVPQYRERMFLVAMHGSIAADWTFPIPSRTADLPHGYRQVRTAALGCRSAEVRANDEDEWRHFQLPPDEVDGALEGLPKAVDLSDAISDMPRIHRRFLTRTFSRQDRAWSYSSGRPSAFQALMRNWPSHQTEGFINDHLTRYLPRDFAIFKKMKHGEEYPAMHRRQTRARNMRARREGLVEGTEAWLALTKQLVPPYPTDKFPNKWFRLVPDQPSRTLLAHLGKDGYTHIHHLDSRVISVREAARLQSFPDGFSFSGSMNSMFRQIGNAVPPLMAYALAKEMVSILSGPKVMLRRQTAVQQCSA